MKTQIVSMNKLASLTLAALLLAPLASLNAPQPASAGETDRVLSVRQLRDLAGTNHWAVYTNNPVLRPGAKGEWDAGALGSMTVLKVGEVFHMYYEAWGSLGKEGSSADYQTLQIGHAVSPDGVHWAKDPANPVLRKGTGKEWDKDGTWDPFVIYEDDQFKMWYGGSLSDRCDWGYAVSTDGVRFVKKGQISHLGNVEDDHVVHDKTTGLYFMYYWDRAKAHWDQVMKGPPAPSGLFVAQSRNETDFDFANARRLSIEGQPWPGKYSHVLRDNNRWVMFYGEAKLRGIPSATGMAFSENLLDWKKAAFPLMRGHDAEVIEAAPGLWLVYYGPDGFFDMPGCDIRVAVYEGRLENLKGAPDLTGTDDRAAPATPPGGFHLGTRRNDETGKASFLLNGQPFYPFVYYEDYRAVTPEFLTHLRSEGFNSIQIATDTYDAGSEDLKRVLELLHRQGIPTFVEINEGEFWKALRADLSLNMVTLDGKPIKHFPDYANPETRRQHLERFARAAQFLKPYAHQPVIGICVGAYDAYHLPEGEKHPDFEAPRLARKYQTLLPFGEHARIRFIQRLKETGVAPPSLGLERLENMVRPPSTPEEASGPLLWQQWIHFRRHLVREWLKDTLDSHSRHLRPRSQAQNTFRGKSHCQEQRLAAGASVPGDAQGDAQSMINWVRIAELQKKTE